MAKWARLNNEHTVIFLSHPCQDPKETLIVRGNISQDPSDPSRMPNFPWNLLLIFNNRVTLLQQGTEHSLFSAKMMAERAAKGLAKCILKVAWEDEE